MGSDEYGEIYRGADKPARVPNPSLTASEGIATASADRPIVTAAGKRAAGIKNVLKS